MRNKAKHGMQLKAILKTNLSKCCKFQRKESSGHCRK